MGLIQVPFGDAMVSRPEPLMQPQHYKTFGVSMPIRTHWRKATCEEVNCEAFREGFVTTIDLSNDQGQMMAKTIREMKGRSFSVQRTGPSMVKVIFPPGTECLLSFQHRVPLDRPSRFFVKGGDFRGNPRGEGRVHKNGAEWAEECAEHLDRLHTKIQRG